MWRSCLTPATPFNTATLSQKQKNKQHTHWWLVILVPSKPSGQVIRTQTFNRIWPVEASTCWTLKKRMLIPRPSASGQMGPLTAPRSLVGDSLFVDPEIRFIDNNSSYHNGHISHIWPLLDLQNPTKCSFLSNFRSSQLSDQPCVVPYGAWWCFFLAVVKI